VSETLIRNAHVVGLTHLDDGQQDVVLSASGPHRFEGGTALGSFDEVVHADGLVLCPGFVDMHSHSDLYRFHTGPHGLPVGDVPKLVQGCTHQVLGQDGYSAAPVRRNDAASYALYISGLDGTLGREFPWESFAEYVTANASIPGTRVSHLVGHSTIRRAVMGMQNREASAEDLERMTTELEKALRAGACGMSTGLVYAPASFSNEAEIVHLCRTLAARDSILFVHLRSESTNVLSAAEEVLEAARIAGARLHPSHIKTAGPANWHLVPKLIDMVETYRQQGITVTADVHPYVAGSTTATVFLPPWFLEGSNEEIITRLRSPLATARARDQMLNDTGSWDNWWQFSSGWKGIVFAEVHDRSLLGRPVETLLREAGIQDTTSLEAFAWFFEQLASSRMRSSIISFNNCEDNIGQFLKLPYVSLCTDGLLNPHGQPHPRAYGTFPRLFKRFVRDLNVLDVPTAVEVSAVRGRRALRLGAESDVVLFDPETIEDHATFENPFQPPTGIEGVWLGSTRIPPGVL